MPCFLHPTHKHNNQPAYEAPKMTLNMTATTAHRPTRHLSIAAPVILTPLFMSDELEGVAPTAESIVDVTGLPLPPGTTETLVMVTGGRSPVEVAGTRLSNVLVAFIVPLRREDDVALNNVVLFKLGTSLMLPRVMSVVVALNVLVTLVAFVSVELHMIDPTDTKFVDSRLGVSLVNGSPPMPVRLPLRYG